GLRADVFLLRRQDPAGRRPSLPAESPLHCCGKMKHGGFRRNRDFLMIDAVLAKIFGTQNERDVKALRPRIVAINALEPEIEQLSDADLAAKTIEFKER